MKIYLAGPDVFRPDAHEWASLARSLCRQYGFEALLPLDHNETDPSAIFQANIAMIRKAQIVAANLDPFRGAEPDSGTAFEVGYAFALGKKVCGYISQPQTLLERVRAASQDDGSTNIPKPVDRNGWVIENFNLPCNLMVSVPTSVVHGGLEVCLRHLRTNRPVA